MRPKPIRVMHVINALGRGGAEVLLVEGLRVADRGSFAFEYGQLLRAPATVAAALTDQGAKVSTFGASGHMSALIRAIPLARYLRRREIDLVHAHLPLAGIVARLAGRIAKVPVVYTEHCPFDSYHEVIQSLSRWTWGLQRRVFAISTDVAESLPSNASRHPVPVRILMNGVNVKDFRPSEVPPASHRESLGFTADTPMVGTVAVLRGGPQKRLDHWLHAAKEVRSRRPGVQFLIVGDGPERGELERLSGELGIRDAVHFVGQQSDVRPFLHAMDIFLMSSAYEGFGIAPVEAMACGVPVVSTDVTGIRNVIQHGHSGLLVPFDDYVVEGLARSVGEVLEQPALHEYLATGGRNRAVEAFSINRMQRQLEEEYRAVLGLNHGGPGGGDQETAHPQAPS